MQISEKRNYGAPLVPGEFSGGKTISCKKTIRRLRLQEHGDNILGFPKTINGCGILWAVCYHLLSPYHLVSDYYYFGGSFESTQRCCFLRGGATLMLVRFHVVFGRLHTHMVCRIVRCPRFCCWGRRVREGCLLGEEPPFFSNSSDAID